MGRLGVSASSRDLRLVSLVPQQRTVRPRSGGVLAMAIPDDPVRVPLWNEGSKAMHGMVLGPDCILAV